MVSFASANGPSVTLSRPPVSDTLAPAMLGARPAVSSSAPAAEASAPNFMMASIRAAGGSVEGWVAFRIIRYRMIGSSRKWPLRSGGRAVEVAGDVRQPGPDEQHRGDEGRCGRAVRAAGDPGEGGQECDAGDAGEPGQTGAAGPGEPRAEHQARRDQ